jgi:hypothetical protein
VGPPKKLLKRLLTGLLVSVTLGIAYFALFGEYEDVSDEARYSDVVGRTFSLTSELLIYGVYADMNNRDAVGHYTITGYPGVGGIEYKSENPLPVGTLLLIESIEECKACPWSDFNLTVEVLSDERFKNAPVYLYGLLDQGGIFGDEKYGKAVLNPTVFTVYEASSNGT